MPKRIGDMPVGSIVYIKENSYPQEYLIAHQGNPNPSIYDSSCDGTWLIRNKLSSVQSSYHSRTDAYDFWSRGATVKDMPTILAQYPSEIQNIIKTVKIPYVYRVVSRGNADIRTLSNGYSCKLFLPSAFELGLPQSGNYYIDGSALSYFSGNSDYKRVAVDRYGYSGPYWTRTPFHDYNFTEVYRVTNDGSLNGWHYQGDSDNPGPQQSRPTMIVPGDLIVDDSSNLTSDTVPVPPASITVPTSPVPSGQSIAISWSSVSGATYKLQRSVNDGSWTDIWSGSSTSYSDTAGSWETVKYRVSAEKSGFSSGFTTSSTVSILQYTISSFSVPSQVMSGQNIPISWSAVQAATTYVLERKVDSGEWTQIYKGSDTSFTDSTGSWSTVQYRIKAGANEVYGSYKESEVVPVVSASTLVISGTDGDLGTLVKDVPYTVSSDTGNPITLERYVNGNLVTKITVQSGFAYSVPVLELPTGTGTIKLVCSVNTSTGGPVTATRIWGYTKAVVSFPNEGAPGVMTKEGKIVFPVSLAECIKVPVNFGGSLDKALELIFPLLNTAVMETGSYEGTGTFGSSNPNKLTFDFNVEIVIISGSDGSLTISNKEPSGGQSDGYIDGQEVTWYSTSADSQFNVQGEIYSYWAVGKAVS